MKKTVLVLSAAVALSVMTGPAALAQESDTSCDAAKDNVTKLEKKRDDAAAQERVDEKADVKAAKDARDAAKAELEALKKRIDNNPPGEPRTPAEEAALKAAEDALTARKADLEKAEKKQAEESNKVAGLRAQVEAAIDARDDACGTTETTTPTPTPTPEPENDVDCDEVDAAEAQRILDADRNDPNNLDQDGDGLACEVDEILPDPDDDNGVTVNNNVAVPSGGVATGGGPAWAFQ